MVTFARRWRLSDQRIRTKLTLILVLPLLAIVALAGVSVVSATSAASTAERARILVVLGTRGAELVERLQSERVAAALVFASGTDARQVDDYQQRTSASDTAIERFRDQRQRSSPPGMFQSLLSRIDGGLRDLRSARLQVLSATDAVAPVVAVRYQALIADLLRLREAVSYLDAVTTVAGRLRAAAALGNAAEALGMMQTTVVRSLTARRITPAAQREIVAADIGFTEAIGEFRRLAPAAWISRYDRVVSGREVSSAERMYGIVARVQPGPLPPLGTDAKGWASAVRIRIRLLHALAAELDSSLVAEIEQRRDAARRDIGLLAGAVGVAILCMIAFGAAVARSLTRSLTGLGAAAEAIARTRLPEMVAQVSAGAIDLDRTRRLVTELAEPIPVLGRDEVGQVAAAFNAVTASAVRLAGEQAVLQGGVRAIFNSLSRRSQRRLNTVMSSLDSLQAKETDPDQLTLLFQLDHAATGLRRLTAGLQVLAGGRAGLVRPEPMVLSDVLRAAQSEIDQYQRIDIGAVDDDVRVHGETVEEVIHLLAELLDNAARFSAPNTLVVIDGRRVGDRLHLQIADAGKGMTEAQLEAARDRIANPHRLDHHAAQQMGLPVVAAIADRLGITVELQPGEPQGTRVDLTLPPALFRIVPSGSPGSWPRDLPAAEAGWLTLSPTLELPVLSAAQPDSPALRAANTTASAPREASVPPGADPVPGNGEPAVDPTERGSGWPLAVSWPGPAATDQDTPSRSPELPAAGPATTAHPEPAPEIYQQLKHAWFGGNSAARLWVASDVETAASERAEFTASGLPRRRQGATMTPARGNGGEQAGRTSVPVAPEWPATARAAARPMTEPPAARHPAGGRSTTELSPVGQRRSRDSEQLRRRYASLDRGLMTARRRSLPSPPQEEQQP